MGGSEPGDSILGDVVASKYEVLRRIGEGGMSTIYEVRHRALGRHFAMKRLGKAQAEDATLLARFRREAEVVASLRHPNIVEIVDWDTLADGTPCMVMELLEGEDLAERLARGPLDWPELADIADQVLSALAAAHQAGVIHRDLKPANIFLARAPTGEERVKLLDFGISKDRHAKEQVTIDRTVLGTPAYMSPEQALGPPEPIGPGTDVWAMGAILYEMATGKQAFVADNVPTVLHRICHEKPAPLAPLRSDAPPAFVALVERVLSRDLERRITRAESLRDGLGEALRSVAPPRRAAISRRPPTRTAESFRPPTMPSERLPIGRRRRHVLWLLPVVAGCAVAFTLLLRRPAPVRSPVSQGERLERQASSTPADAAPARGGDTMNRTLDGVDVARVKQERGRELGRLGRYAEALVTYREAEALFIEAGDRLATAGALGEEAALRRTAGDLAGARQLNDAALAIYREMGEKKLRAPPR